MVAFPQQTMWMLMAVSKVTGGGTFLFGLLFLFVFYLVYIIYLLKGTWILFHFLFLMEKSIFYAKDDSISKIIFLKFSFTYYLGLLFS